MKKSDCHPEQAFFAQRRIWAGRAKCRAASNKKRRDTIIARLDRFLINRLPPAGPLP